MNRMAILSNFHDTVSGPLTYLYQFSKLHPDVDILILEEDDCTKYNLLDNLDIPYKVVKSTDKLDYDYIYLLSYIGRRDIGFYEKDEVPYSTKFLLNQDSKVGILIHDSRWVNWFNRIIDTLFTPLGDRLDRLIFWRESVYNGWKSTLKGKLKGVKLVIKTPEYYFSDKSMEVMPKSQRSISMNCRCNMDKSWRFAEKLSKEDFIYKCFYGFSTQVDKEDRDAEESRNYSDKVSIQYNYLPNYVGKFLDKAQVCVNVTNNEWDDKVSPYDPLEWATYEAINSLNFLVVNKHQFRVLQAIGIHAYCVNNFDDYEEWKKVINLALDQYDIEVALDNRERLRKFNQMAMIKNSI